MRENGGKPTHSYQEEKSTIKYKNYMKKYNLSNYIKLHL